VASVSRSIGRLRGAKAWSEGYPSSQVLQKPTVPTVLRVVDCTDDSELDDKAGILGFAAQSTAHAS